MVIHPILGRLTALVPGSLTGAFGDEFALPAFLVIETGVLAVLSIATWRRRKDAPVAIPFGFILVLFTLLVGGYALQVIATDLPTKVILYKVSQSAMILSPVPWVVFTLYFTGRQHLVTAERAIIGSTIHVALLFCLWSNPLHGLFYTGFELADTGLLLVGWGPLHWLTVWYDYLLIGVGVVLLSEMYLTSGIHRRSIVAILIGVFVPWVANMTEFVGVDVLRGLNLTAIAIVVTGVAWYLAIFRFDVLTLLPIAREQAFDALNDGVIVADKRGRVVDSNPAASSLLPLDGGLVGRDVSDILDDAVESPTEYLVREGHRSAETITFGQRTVHLDLQSIALDSLRGDPAGYVLVLRDVTPIREREQRLRRQNERLEEFAGIVSHDLRNPLNVAYGYAELVGETGEAEHADALLAALDRMDLIIDDVLTLAREGDTVEETESLSLRAVSTEAWANVETGDAGLEIDSSSRVNGDKGRVLQLFENLFRNAVEHADEPSIRLGILPSMDGFFVEDDGPGIPADEREKVLESGFTTEEEGTGFGLAIVTRIAEAHGWSIRVTDSPGGGARFEFTGAIEDDANPADEPTQAD